MNIWDKVFAGLILPLSLAMFILAAMILKKDRELGVEANEMREQIAVKTQENQRLRDGDDRSPAISELRMNLHTVLVARGRAWTNCQVNVEPSGAASVNVPQPDPHGIEPDTVVYVFEEKPVEQAGQYLGPFKVTQVGAGQVGIEPATVLSRRQRERITSSTGPWRLYENMPSDSRQAMQRLSRQQLARMVPKSIADFTQDPASRPLRDYDVLLREYERRRLTLTDRVQAAREDAAKVVASAKQAVTQEATDLKDRDRYRAELARRRGEHELVSTYVTSLEEQLRRTEKAVQTTLEENKALAARYRAIQLDAVKRIGGTGAEVASSLAR